MHLKLGRISHDEKTDENAVCAKPKRNQPAILTKPGFVIDRSKRIPWTLQLLQVLHFMGQTSPNKNETWNAFFFETVFSKLVVKQFSKTTQLILMKFYTGLKILLTTIWTKIFFKLNYLLKKKVMLSKFYQNLICFQNICAKNSSFTFFNFNQTSNLIIMITSNGLNKKTNFSFFTSDGSVMTSTVNTEAHFRRGQGKWRRYSRILNIFLWKFQKKILKRKFE